MLGRSHALSGALVALALAPLAHLAVDPTIEAVLLAAGATLLPDLDHHGSTAAHALGPVSRLAAGGVQRLAGHRGALHSLAAALIVGSLVAFTALLSPLAVPVVAGAVTGLGVLGLWHRRGRRRLALLAALGVAVAWLMGATLPAAVLGVVVGGGMIVHLAGDSLTTGGVPLLWPLRQRFSLPILGHTGSLREVVVRWGMVVAVGVLAAHLVGL